MNTYKLEMVKIFKCEVREMQAGKRKCQMWRRKFMKKTTIENTKKNINIGESSEE